MTGRPRRRQSDLEAALERSVQASERALAHFELALFHDNNGREVLAVPHYREAIRLGLSDDRRAEALAWLASSLFKTGHPEEASEPADQSLALSKTPDLTRFLAGLKRRIARTRSR